MKTETRKQIESIKELITLVNSKEWANDNVGLLHRKAMNIMLSNDITEEDALEWLHEED